MNRHFTEENEEEDHFQKLSLLPGTQVTDVDFGEMTNDHIIPIHRLRQGYPGN